MAVFFSAIAFICPDLSAQSLTALDQDISNVVHEASMGVVTIEARPSEIRAPVYPGQELKQSNPVNTAVGSGLVIDSLGHILTILSLVEGFDEFRVMINNVDQEARLVGKDQRFNLAVLKIDTIFSDYLEMSPIPPLVGRLAVGFGHAIGRTGFPTLGVIAGRRADGSYLMSGSALPGLLGGGVFDLSGKLIGIITSGSVTDGHIGENFWGGLVLLPAAAAYAAADRIICCGDREAGYLGVKTTAIELVSSDGKIIGEGVVVSHIEPGSPAEKSGLQLGDIVTRFNSREVASDLELQRLVSGAGSGNTVEIELIRNRQSRRENIRLTNHPDRSHIAQSSQFTSAWNQSSGPARLRHQIDSLGSELIRIQAELDFLLQRLDASR